MPRRPLAVLPLAVVLLVAGPAAADEGDGAPAWSQPTGGPPRSALPPPRVIDPSAPGRPLPAPPPPAPAPAAPLAPAPLPPVPAPAPAPAPYYPQPLTGPYPTATPAASSTRESATGSTLSLAPTPTEAAPPGAAWGLPLAPRMQPESEKPRVPTLAEILAAAPDESAVLHIEKNHNRPWYGLWLALELEIWFSVVGQAGRNVGASVTFYDERNGRPLRARMEPYVDGRGNVSVYTKPVRMESDRRFYRARLKIPYRAFPWPTRGQDYAVLAHVRLLRQEPSGTVAMLAEGSTVFTIQAQRGCWECVTESEEREAAKPFFVRALERDLDGLFDDEMRDPESGPGPAPRDGWESKDWFEWKWPACETPERPPEPKRCRAVGQPICR